MRELPKGSLRWKIMEWLTFGCPPHDLGPMQDTPMGYGQRCSKCRLWKWRDDAVTAIAGLNARRPEA